MTLTIDIPDAIATRLTQILPAVERDKFAAAAIAEALDLRELDSAETVAAVEQALADMDEGRNLIPFDEVCRQWDLDRETRPAADK